MPNSRNFRGTYSPQQTALIKTYGQDIKNSEEFQGNKLTDSIIN